MRKWKRAPWIACLPISGFPLPRSNLRECKMSTVEDRLKAVGPRMAHDGPTSHELSPPKPSKQHVLIQAQILVVALRRRFRCSSTKSKIKLDKGTHP